MSLVKIQSNASGTGTITLSAPNTNTDYTLSLPAVTSTLVGTDATQTLTNKTIQGGTITSGTAVATTSGTSVDFTSIPSWVKRITFVYSGVSSNGVSSFLIQIGPSSAVETTGYLSTGNTTGASGSVVVSSTAGFIIYEDNPGYTVQGIATMINVTGNTWVFSQVGRLTAGNCTYGGGDKTLASTLARLRFTTVNGTDAFDAGTVNIIYEG